MAHYFGEIESQGKPAHRLGSRSSGLTVTAASWDGAITVELYFDPATNQDHYRVTRTPWRLSDTSPPEVLATGPLARETRP